MLFLFLCVLLYKLKTPQEGEVPVCIFQNRAGKKAHPHAIPFAQDPFQDSCVMTDLDDNRLSQSRDLLSGCLQK